MPLDRPGVRNSLLQLPTIVGMLAICQWRVITGVTSDRHAIRIVAPVVPCRGGRSKEGGMAGEADRAVLDRFSSYCPRTAPPTSLITNLLAVVPLAASGKQQWCTAD